MRNLRDSSVQIKLSTLAKIFVRSNTDRSPIEFDFFIFDFCSSVFSFESNTIVDRSVADRTPIRPIRIRIEFDFYSIFIRLCSIFLRFASVKIRNRFEFYSNRFDFCSKSLRFLFEMSSIFVRFMFENSLIFVRFQFDIFLKSKTKKKFNFFLIYHKSSSFWFSFDFCLIFI
jgi:hypothetical protein